MSFTTRDNTLAETIINVIIDRFPSLYWDYTAKAAPLATPPAK